MMKYRWWLLREYKTNKPSGLRTSVAEGYRADVFSNSDGRFDAFVCHPELNSTNESVYSNSNHDFATPWDAIEWCERFIEDALISEREEDEES